GSSILLVAVCDGQLVLDAVIVQVLHKSTLKLASIVAAHLFDHMLLCTFELLLHPDAKVGEGFKYLARGFTLQHIHISVLGEVVHEQNEVSRAIISDTLGLADISVDELKRGT